MSSQINFSFTEFRQLAAVMIKIADGQSESNNIVFGDPTSGDYIEFVAFSDDAPEVVEQKAAIEAAHADFEFAKSNGLTEDEYLLIRKLSSVVNQTTRELIEEFIAHRAENAIELAD